MNISKDIKPVTSIDILKLISQGEIDIKNGRVKSRDDVFKHIENSLREKT
jgi:hypothetical protein